VDIRSVSGSQYGSGADFRLWAAAGVTFLFYVILWGLYRPYNIDDPWSLSFSYSFCHRQSELDLAFGGRFPNGMGGTIAFGKLAAFTQCAVFDLFGWTRTALEVLSKTVSLAGLALMGLFLSRIGIGRRIIFCYIVAFAALEPFFGMASQAKYECFTFLLLFGSLLLVSNGRWFLAGLMAATAVEIQPMGILAPVMTAICLAFTHDGDRRERVRAWAALLAGGALVIPVYFLLHPHIFTAFTPVGGLEASWLLHPGFLYAYFWETQYKRHLPELAVFLCAIALFLIRRRGDEQARRWGRFTFACLIAATAASFLLKWPNYNYAVFWYWAALLLVFRVAGTYARASWVCLIAVLYIMPQYGFVFAKNRNGGFSNEEFGALRTAIGQVAGTADAVPVFGDYTLWFAMPEQFTVANHQNIGLAGQAAVVACFDKLLVNDPQMLTCEEIQSVIDLVPASQVDLGPTTVRLFKVAPTQGASRS
jgi:hypothetical protein